MCDFQIYNENHTFRMKRGVKDEGDVAFLSFLEDRENNSTRVETRVGSLTELRSPLFEPKLTNIYMILGIAILYVIVISLYVYVVITVVIS
jgi:hypothetical protein